MIVDSDFRSVLDGANGYRDRSASIMMMEVSQGISEDVDDDSKELQELWW